MIITLCGAPRFKAEIEHVAAELASLGHTAFRPEVVMGKIEEPTMLLLMVHAQKILASAEVWVVTKPTDKFPTGYIDPGTKTKIIFANANNIPVVYVDEECPELMHD